MGQCGGVCCLRSLLGRMQRCQTEDCSRPGKDQWLGRPPPDRPPGASSPHSTPKLLRQMDECLSPQNKGKMLSLKHIRNTQIRRRGTVNAHIIMISECGMASRRAFNPASSAFVSFFLRRSSLTETGWTANSLCGSLQAFSQVSGSFHQNPRCPHFYSHFLMEWNLTCAVP